MPASAPKTKWFVLGREPLIAAAEIGAVLGLKKCDYSPPILKVDGLFRNSPLGRGRGGLAYLPLTKREREGVVPIVNRGSSTAVGTEVSALTPPTPSRAEWDASFQPTHGLEAFPAQAGNKQSHDLIGRLGGTIKIAEEIADSVNEEKLKNIIEEELKKVEGKINFGLSFYAPAKIDVREVKNLGLQIKKSLKAQGYSVRYVENKEPALSSVTVEKNGLTGRGREFLIQRNHAAQRPLKRGAVESIFSLAKTEAVQPFEEFGARDFGRPGRDDVSGMLPPKLAMIMINLSQTKKDGVLLDPFCGSGTIISEAMLLGYKNIIGSDITEKSVADTKLNIDWTKQRYGAQTSNIKIWQSDIKDVGRHIAKQSIDAIATEPYLGAPLKGNESQEILHSQANELKLLYIEAFKQFAPLLKPRGAVVFIIPRFKFKNDWITIDCQKEIEALGFKSVPFLEQYPHLLYARPNQRVGREIWRFEKK